MLGAEADPAGRWNEVKDFLGYAPVLTVIAESLAVANPSAERGSLKAADSNTLLKDIIEAILDREHRKFADNLTPRLTAQNPADSPDIIPMEALYTAEEQQIRLLSLVTNNQINVDLPTSLPTELRTMYNDSAEQFLRDHPFVRNEQFASQVFGDYVWAATAGSTFATAVLERSPASSISNVGSFFAGFIHAMGGGVLSESLIEPVVKSWLQESEVYASKDYEVILEVHQGFGHLRCWRLEPNGDHSELQFQLTDISPVLVLNSPLHRMAIATDQCISLVSNSGVLQVGPGSLIVCDELELDAETLRVEMDPERTFSFAVACSKVTADRLTKLEGQPNSTRIFSDNTPPFLAAYRAKLELNDTRVAYGRYIDLRSILTAFRGTTSDYLAASADKIDQVIVRENPYRLRILTYLQDHGALTRYQSQYRLDLTRLGGFGFSLRDLKTGPNDAVLSFLIRCGCDS